MNARSRVSLAAGVYLGGVMLAAPAAAQISTAAALLLQQGVDGIQDFRSTGDRFGTALAWGDFNGDGFDDLAIGVPDEDVIGVDEGSIQVVLGGPAGLTAAGDQRFVRVAMPGTGSSHDGDRMGHALAAGDFDGDGFSDLAIGIPGDVVSDEPLAGSVVVLYGSPAGLETAGAQLWNQDVGTILEAAEVGDSFGAALAAGDFDGDGFAELAIGAPFEAFGAALAAGVVHVLHGSADGLQQADDLLIDRGSFGGPPPAFDDHFGAALAAGDLDGDGHVDLTIGAPGRDVGFDAVGSVFVALGSVTGLDPSDSTLRKFVFRGQTVCRHLGATEGGEAGDRFGTTVATGDFDGDGDADLAVGITGATVDSSAGAGQVNVIYTFGVLIEGDCWNQSVPGVGGGGFADTDEHFGASLAAGDLTGDGRADLVVGVPGQRLGPVVGFGGLHVFHGDSGGLKPAVEPFWSQNTPGVPNGIEPGDAFAFAVALGDANGDGSADLAVGVPGEEIDNSRPNHGAIHVLYSGGRIFADGFEIGDLSAWSSTTQ